MQKKGSLSELGNQWFLAFLVVDQFCYIFVIVREAVFGGDHVLEFYGGKPRMAVASDLINL